MIFDDAFAAMAAPEDELPETAMRWSLDHWDQAGPRFTELLDRYVSGADRSEAAERVLFFAIHLMAEKAERAAFPSLCRLLHDWEAAETVLGDAITEHLSGILISTFDGDRIALEGVISVEYGDDFVRSAAVDAMAFLTRTGDVTEAQMRSLLTRIFGNLGIEETEATAVSLVNAVSSLGYQDLTREVMKLFTNIVTLTSFMEFEDFEEDLELTLADATGMAGFIREGIGPFTDAIGQLSSWQVGASAEDPQDWPPLADWPGASGQSSRLGAPLPAVPVTNPLRGVGRNDPCPCGSGKKYKKCCLV